MSLQPMSFINFDKNMSYSSLLYLLSTETRVVTISRLDLLPDTIIASFDNDDFIMIVHQGPLDLNIVQDDLAQKNAWPEWESEIMAWRSYVVVSLRDTKPKEDLGRRALKLFRFTSWLMSLLPAHSVGWSGSNLFKSSSDFLDLLNSSQPPVEILVRCVWTATPTSHDKHLLGALTRGLSAFGRDEIEHSPTNCNFIVLYNRLMYLATYLLSEDVHFKDRDTVSFEDGTLASLRLMPDSGRLLLVTENMS